MSARFFRAYLASFVLTALTACTHIAATEKPPGLHDADRVLVVINRQSRSSETVGQYYMQHRDIPPTHVVRIDVPDRDEIGELEFRARIVNPIRDAIAALPVRIDFIVLTTGVPLRIDGKNGYSVDAHVAGMNLPIPPMVGFDTAWLARYRNPYFRAKVPFNSTTFGMFLVTRLDGATVADCIALIDHAIVARPVRGPFFFDATPDGSDAGYRIINRSMYAAVARLREAGADVQLDSTPHFVAPALPVMGYVSWGSNDVHFDTVVYHRVKFIPGALAETFVSTSGRTFRASNGGQSKIADLVAQGVTGVKGYVSEPYTIAMADAGVLFEHYLSGYTLAESFYAASRLILWKDIVIGDPLCAPYAAARVQ